MKVIAKQPSECTIEEIQEFVTLVNEGSEVDSAGLTGRVKNAELLIFVKNETLVGVGSIKVPNSNYKNRVFLKAGHAKEASKFEFEIGYFFILPSCRGQKLSSVIMTEINKHLNKRNCFATTRTDNEAMIYILGKNEFQRLGQDYASESGDYKLVLHANEAR